MTYRIVMNGNGEFKVQRRCLWWWECWADNSYGGWCQKSWGTVYPTSEEACAALLRAQEYDTRNRRAHRWIVAVKETTR